MLSSLSSFPPGSQPLALGTEKGMSHRRHRGRKFKVKGACPSTPPNQEATESGHWVTQLLQERAWGLAAPVLGYAPPEGALGLRVRRRVGGGFVGKRGGGRASARPE